MEKLVFNIFFILIAVMAFFRIIRYYSARVAKLNLEDPEHNCKVSVIIPCRNEEKRLKYLLESLRKQTYKDFEVIVVDDDSVDRTVEVAKSYGSRVISRKEVFPDWEGKSAACYAGAINASGEILLFLDADVMLEEEALEYLLRYFRSDSVVSCQPYHYIERLYENLSLIPNIIAIVALRAGKQNKPFSTDNGLYGPCIMITKDLYLETGGHKLVAKSIIEDVDLGIKLSKMGIPITIIPHNNLIKFRMYPEGIRYLFDGWSKNMALGASVTKPIELLMITSVIASSLGTFHSLIMSIIQRDVFLASLYSGFYLVLGYLIFFTSRKIGSFSPLVILFHYIITIFFCIVFVRSVLLKVTRSKIYWRGREVQL